MVLELLPNAVSAGRAGGWLMRSISSIDGYSIDEIGGGSSAPRVRGITGHPSCPDTRPPALLPPRWFGGCTGSGLPTLGNLADQHFYPRGDSTFPAQRVCVPREKHPGHAGRPDTVGDMGV